ncbi:MAG: nickel-dependent hydrogenase large subunit [Desulfobacteraceae bacterium]|nr:nickel-dependent hydrogenase large subunit [Desulfobacteraceae bacterium]
MAEKIEIDPITRIEGHLAVSVEVEEGRVARAFCKGEMFRGFELILKGRDPLDAQQITQRICGVCPVSHGMASVLAQEQAYGITPNENGRLVRNLILGANYLQSHIIHFYHLSAVDFIDLEAIAQYQGKDAALNEFKAWVGTQKASSVVAPGAPFLPRYAGDYLDGTDANITAIKHYLEGLRMRALAHQMAALFAGKLPHVASLVPGGVTERVTTQKIAAYGAMLQELRSFINRSYLPDVMSVAAGFPSYFKLGKGCGNFLAYGAFAESADNSRKYLPAGVVIGGRLAEFDPRQITEDVKYSYYQSASGLAPAAGQTVPRPGKPDAYTWLKATRYKGMAMEVGPLSRILIAYLSGTDPEVRQAVDHGLNQLNRSTEDLDSAMGRHAARAIECKLVADQCARWLDQLKPGEPACVDFTIPRSGQGVGLCEAPRGALGHWLAIDDYKIASYQCVVPTTWNCSPKDDQGHPGPVEQALIGTPIANAAQPIEAARVVRSFDPCLACAVH